MVPAGQSAWTWPHRLSASSQKFLAFTLWLTGHSVQRICHGFPALDWPPLGADEAEGHHGQAIPKSFIFLASHTVAMKFHTPGGLQL